MPGQLDALLSSLRQVVTWSNVWLAAQPAHAEQRESLCKALDAIDAEATDEP
jgi:hypothetical protein